MADSKNWIKSAINPKTKGSLRKTLGVKKGESIPMKKLKEAEKSKNPTTRKRASLAITLKKLNKGK